MSSNNKQRTSGKKSKPPAGKQGTSKAGAQLSDEVLDVVSGGATVPVRRLKPGESRPRTCS